MSYFIENTLENLTMIRTVTGSFPSIETTELFNTFKHLNTILLAVGEHPTPQFRFRDIPQAVYLSEAELRALVFTLSLEQ